MIDFDDYSLLSSKVQKPLEFIKLKLEKDYLPFFLSVSGQYKGKAQTKEQKLVSDMVSMVHSCVGEIDSLSDISDVTIIKKKTDNILLRLKDIQDSAQWFAKSENLSESMKGRFEKATTETDTTIGEISRTSKIITNRTEEVLKKPTKLERIIRGVGDTDFGKQMTSGLGKSFLGPFGGMIGQIGQGIDYFKKRNETLKQKAFVEATMTGGRKSGAEAELRHEYLHGEQEVPKEKAKKSGWENIFGGNKQREKDEYYRSSMFGGGFGKREKEQSSGFGEARGMGGAGFARAGSVGGGSLFDFFNVGAYKAKWTKELLEAVTGKKMGVEKVQKSEGLAGMLKGLLPMLGPILAVLGATIGGWIIGRGIGQIKIGDKKIDEHVEGFISNQLIKSDKSKATRSRNESNMNPKVKRALDLQDQGMSPEESLKQAQAELGQPVNKTSVQNNNNNVEKITTETKESVVLQNMQKQQDNLTKPLNEIAENTKKKTQSGTSSGTNKSVYDSGNPVLDGMNSGIIDIKG